MRSRRFPRGKACRTVVDLGAGHVVRAGFERTAAGGLRLVAWEAARHRSDLAGFDAWRTEMGASLAKVAGSRPGGARESEIWLGLPGHVGLTKWMTTPAVAGAKRARLIRFEASQAIPYPLEEVAWDCEVVAGDAVELEVLLAAARTEAVDAVNAAAMAAGRTLARATPACVALHRGFRYNHPDATGCSLLVNIGARSTSLLFIEPARHRGRTLVLGGDAVTRAIADDLRIDFVDAERLKCRTGWKTTAADDPVATAVRRAAEGFAGRLALEIARSQATLGRQPARVHLSGGGASLEGLTEALAEKLKLPVERYDPLRRVEIAEGVATGGEACAELVGLACIAWNSTRVGGRGPNLLTKEMIAARRFRRFRPALLAAAAGVVLALGVAAHFFGRQADEARRSAAAREVELRPVRAAQARIAAQEGELVALRRQVEAARARAAAKTAWRDFLRDLQERLSAVEDGWIETVTVGRERDRADDATAAPALRLRLSSRLLDTGAAADERARRLLASVAGSPFVAAIEDERFDRNQPGVLRMDFTLVAKPESAL